MTESTEDLAMVRAAIRERRRLYELGRDILVNDDDLGDLGVVRCNEPHSKKDKPKLAEFTIIDGHLLFLSRIEWLPSDQLTLRPWMREHLEGPGLDDDEFERHMVDDDLLRHTTRHFDDWQAGHVAQGERWLTRATETWVRVAIPLAKGLPFATHLWVRCPRHPEKAEALDPLALVDSLR